MKLQMSCGTWLLSVLLPAFILLGLTPAGNWTSSGGTRRAIEAAQADIEAAKEDLNNVLVSLLAEVRTYQTRLTKTE